MDRETIVVESLVPTSKFKPLRIPIRCRIDGSTAIIPRIVLDNIPIEPSSVIPFTEWLYQTF